MSHRVRLLALGLAWSLCAGSALAEPSASDRATARALADDGGDALDKKNYEVALDRFGRADALVHAPTLLLGVARAQVGLRKFVEAQESYQSIIREGVVAGAPPAFAKAMQDAQREIKAIASKLAWVTITIKEPRATAVTIDGTELPRAALDVKRAINPGSHVVKATADGYSPGTATFEIGEGESTAVTLTLEPASGSAPVPTDSPAAVSADPNLASSATLPDTAAPRSSSQRTLGFIGLGVGAAGLVVGSVSGLVAMSRHSTLESDCPTGKCRSSDQSTIDGFRTMATVSTVGFVIGGVAAAAGGALLLTAPRPAQTGRVEPYVGIACAGARIRF